MRTGDFHDLLGRLSVARSLLGVCHRSLSTFTAADGPSQEADTLAVAIDILSDVYNDVDSLSPRDS